MERFTVLASAMTFSLALFCASAAAQGAAPASAADIAMTLKPYALATQTCRAALEQAATLSSQGKWKSAYQAMDDFDKANDDPFALAMKTNLFLKGAVRTDMNRSFGLIDLAEGQDLDTLRNGEGDYPSIPFDPPALADAQAAKGLPAPGILSKELGDYYYDVLGRFSGQWAISDEEILAKIDENYAKAYGAGVFDGKSLINQGETLVRLNRGAESDAIFRKAIALDSRDANVRYSYALSLSYRGKKAEALAEIDRAIDYFGEDSSRIEAIALGARTAIELGNDARAQAYFAIADKSYPDNPTPGILRHLIAVETGHKEAAAAAADGLVALYGANPDVVRTLISTWFSAGEAAEARVFLQRNISKNGDDMTIGTLDFYLAVLMSQDSPTDADRAAALKILDDAEARFKTKLGPDNEVFVAITGIRNALQPQTAPAPEAGE